MSNLNDGTGENDAEEPTEATVVDEVNAIPVSAPSEPEELPETAVDGMED